MQTIKRTIRFISATAAEWATSQRILAVNDVAIISDDPTRVKWGQAKDSYSVVNNIGKTFAQLPYTDLGGALYKAIPPNPFAANATATLTAAQILQKYITSTSAAATTLTLDTWANIMTALGITVAAAAKGIEIDFEIDNSAGANIVTVAVGTGITAATPALTGGAALTVAVGSFGKFKLIGKSLTAALIFRTL